MKKIKLILVGASLLLSAVVLKAQLSTCATLGPCASNLVFNGDFRAGNVGFTTGLTGGVLGNLCACGTNSYCIANEPRTKCNMASWVDDLWDFDMGTNLGSYMVIDGNPGLGGAGVGLIWSQPVSMVNGASYVFKMHVMPSVSLASPGQNLNVTVGGMNIGANPTSPTGSYVAGMYVWNEVCVPFTYTGATGVVALSISQIGQVANGDYGIDAISLNVDNESWHQTTKNAVSRDQTKDVITDAAGDVYVTGYYTSQTTLEGGNNADVTLLSGSSTLAPTSYIAKYSACGDLLWEAHAKDFLNNYGNSIVLDQPNNRVYITGDFEGRIRFTTSNICSGLPTSITASLSGSRGYVAAFDMTTGCIEILEAINVSAYTRCEAITINETNGAIYVGGAKSTTSGGTDPSSFINKYTPAGTLGGLIATVTSTTTAGGVNKVEDMDFNETTNTLWAIGSFTKNVTFVPGGTLTYGGPVVIKDAFLVSYTDGGTFFTSTLLRRGNNTLYMTGEGIAVDASDNSVYITGSYRDQATAAQPAFQTASLLLSTVGSTTDKAYMIKIAGLGIWAKSGIATSNIANGKSVGARMGVAYFTGNYYKNILQLTGYPSVLYYTVGAPNNLSHSYTAAYNANGTIAFPTVNVTGDVSNTGVHEVESIYSGVNGHSFMVGAYSSSLRVDNLLVSPTNDLLSSGAAGHKNGFLVRVNSNFAGAYRSEEVAIENNMKVAKFELSQLSVYPNPTNGLTTIAIDNFDATNTNYKLVLYNSVGQLMQQLDVTSNKTDIDLSDYKNGLYILSFSDGVNTSVVRISKIN
ncbi:MAG: T9SS type A sorting domain-containing protein [Bacteroidetes bacterium]|nr:T9SS type A sorting domain-containing protein [Bacteroidota bacterium]